MALEARIGTDVGKHVEIAVRAAAGARVAAAGEPDPLAVVDPRRHVDRQRARSRASVPARRRCWQGLRATFPSPSHWSHV